MARARDRGREGEGGSKKERQHNPSYPILDLLKNSIFIFEIVEEVWPLFPHPTPSLHFLVSTLILTICKWISHCGLEFGFRCLNWIIWITSNIHPFAAADAGGAADKLLRHLNVVWVCVSPENCLLHASTYLNSTWYANSFAVFPISPTNSFARVCLCLLFSPFRLYLAVVFRMRTSFSGCTRTNK